MMRVSSKMTDPLHSGQAMMRLSSSSIIRPPPLAAGRVSPGKFGAEVLHRQLEALIGVHARLPVEQGPRPGDVGLPHLRIVLGQRAEDDLAARAGQSDDALGQL